MREVVAVLATDDVRARVLGAFRAAGGSLDRWHAADHAAMAHELTKAEDRAELVGRITPIRAALRAIGRRLEGP